MCEQESFHTVHESHVGGSKPYLNISIGVNLKVSGQRFDDVTKFLNVIINI